MGHETRILGRGLRNRLIAQHVILLEKVHGGTWILLTCDSDFLLSGILGRELFFSLKRAIFIPRTDAHVIKALRGGLDDILEAISELSRCGLPPFVVVTDEVHRSMIKRKYGLKDEHLVVV